MIIHQPPLCDFDILTEQILNNKYTSDVNMEFNAQSLTFRHMSEESYGFSPEHSTNWKYFEQQIMGRFFYTPTAQEELHEFLKQGEAPTNDLLDILSRTVNESYYSENNARFYHMSIPLGKSHNGLTQYFLDNAKNEVRKPTAIKNGNCCDAAFEFRELLHRINAPSLSSERVIGRYELPPEYVNEGKPFFYHVLTAVGDKTNWALINSYTPRNNFTVLQNDQLPEVAFEQREGQIER